MILPLGLPCCGTDFFHFLWMHVLSNERRERNPKKRRKRQRSTPTPPRLAFQSSLVLQSDFHPLFKSRVRTSLIRTPTPPLSQYSLLKRRREAKGLNRSALWNHSPNDKGRFEESRLIRSQWRRNFQAHSLFCHLEGARRSPQSKRKSLDDHWIKRQTDEYDPEWKSNSLSLIIEADFPLIQCLRWGRTLLSTKEKMELKE